MKIQKMRIAVAALLLMAAVVCYGYTRGRSVLSKDAKAWPVSEEPGQELLLSQPASDGAAHGDVETPDMEGPRQSEAEDPGNGAPEESETALACYVHICGEVVSPGVYELLEGSRVFEAVEAAGGFTEDAAGEYLNLAETIRDGMKLVVPSKEEAEEAAGAVFGAAYGSSGLPEGQKNVSDGKVNINTATKEELMTLRGIGQARAEDIIRYREERGRFERPEDIMKVSGIKNAAFDKIKDDITV